jgi:hypothetical protein
LGQIYSWSQICLTWLLLWFLFILLLNKHLFVLMRLYDDFFYWLNLKIRNMRFRKCRYAPRAS